MSRPTGVMKVSNEYAQLFPDYDRIPKAVFAAIAASALNVCFCEDDLTKVNGALIREWQTLHNAGIVPQKPIAEVA